MKHLVLASRRGDQDSNAGPVANELSALGAEVRIVSADITKEVDVRRLLELANSPRELKGIFHCAGLLDDGILLQMSWAKFWRVMAPKVIGGWLLSELSRDCQSRMFCRLFIDPEPYQDRPAKPTIRPRTRFWMRWSFGGAPRGCRRSH